MYRLKFYWFFIAYFFSVTFLFCNLSDDIAKNDTYLFSVYCIRAIDTSDFEGMEHVSKLLAASEFSLQDQVDQYYRQLKKDLKEKLDFKLNESKKKHSVYSWASVKKKVSLFENQCFVPNGIEPVTLASKKKIKTYLEKKFLGRSNLAFAVYLHMDLKLVKIAEGFGYGNALVRSKYKFRLFRIKNKKISSVLKTTKVGHSKTKVKFELSGLIQENQIKPLVEESMVDAHEKIIEYLKFRLKK